MGDWRISDKSIWPGCQLIQFTFDASYVTFSCLYYWRYTIDSWWRDQINPNQLMIWMWEQRVTLVHTIPSIFRLLTKEVTIADSFPYSYILLSWTLYGKDIIEWSNRAGTRTELVNLYGLTETTLIKTFNRIDFKVYTDPFAPVMLVAYECCWNPYCWWGLRCQRERKGRYSSGQNTYPRDIISGQR